MFRIRKSFTFEAAHQLSRAYSKECTDTIHGHSYTAELFVTSKRLDDCGMVVDFGILKGFIEKKKLAWDHALFLAKDTADQYMDLENNSKKVVIFDTNPTAETMAKVMFEALKDYLQPKTELKVERVRIHETATGWAEYGE